MSDRPRITQKLRDSMKRHDNFDGTSRVVLGEAGFNNLCDAIDSIHAALEAENNNLKVKYVNANRRSIDLEAKCERLRDSLIELPKDMDDEPICIGDVMEWSDGKTFEVVGIGDGTLFYVETDENGSSSIEWTSCNLKRHHNHAPTVESVLREFVREWCTAPREKDGNELLAEYAKRLTLVGDSE